MDGAFAQTLNDNMSDPAPTTTNNNNELQNHLATLSENENNFISTLPNKPEVKIKKHDEAKVMTDSNENSLSVDTLIEILSSSNGTTSNNLPEKTTSSSSSTPKTTARAAKASATIVKIKSSSDSKMKAPPPAAAVKKSSTSSVNSSSKKPSAKAVNSKKLASPLFGGKPTITDLNRKMKQAAAAKQRQPRTVYQSQISDNSVGIKICIKKSINSQKKVPSGSSSSSSSKASPSTSSSSSSAAKLKRRSRKSKLKERAGSDSEDGYVKRRKKATSSAATSEQKQKQQESSALDDGPVQEQSRWATHMPKEILFEVR